uniref:Fucosyltransferase n=1 Tax=Pogona vitticeps TaxID=103695 RepID=A0ABM5F6R7_9SAUR
MVASPVKRFVGTAVLFAVLWNVVFLGQWLDSFGRPREPPLTVLIWDWPQGRPLNLTGDLCATRYQIEGCHLTGDRRLYGDADVVAFHHRELQKDRARLPRAKGNPGQKWVWVSLESPSHSDALSGWNGTEWDWVMTYRRDSDIFVPYGELIPRAPDDKVDIPEKTGLVAWVISNFHHHQERAQLALNLSRHLQIDVYGKASKKPLCPGCLLPTIARYKFYLAFENSIHRDYITEKLWRNSLLAGAVPVVLGPPRANYEEFIPAETFIHVQDFGSVEDLAGFLAHMNESHYRRYFAWKRRYRVKLYDDWRERFCTICRRYPHLPQGKVYPDLKSWFWD